MNAQSRMEADRRLRDSAKAVLDADIAFLKGDLERRPLGERAGDRVKNAARDVLDSGREIATDHKGVVAIAGAALALWLARHPLLALLGLGGSQGDGEEQDGTAAGS